MKEDAAHRTSCPDEIRVLAFTSSGVKIGIDTDQIARLTGIEEAEGRDWKPFSLPGRPALRGVSSPDPAAKVLLARGEGPPIALAIDRLDEIFSVPVDDLRPLPHLITSSSAFHAVWGAVIRNGEIILLVDIYKLSAGRPPAGAEPAA